MLLGKSYDHWKTTPSGMFFNFVMFVLIGLTLLEAADNNSENIFTDFRTYCSVIPFLFSLNFLNLFIQYVWKKYVKKEEKYWES